MISTLYLAIAVVDFALLVWAIDQLRKYRTAGVFFAMLPLTLLWYDNFTVGIGRFIGEGDLLYGLNYIRFVGHYLGLPMSFIALGFMAREAGFTWAQPKIFLAAFFLLAAFFMVEDMWAFFNNLPLKASCAADTLRYSTKVLEAYQCGPDGFTGGTTVPPVAPILMTVMMIIFGIVLWAKLGWKWLALGSAGAMPFFGIMRDFGGGVIANIGEPIITGVIVLTAAYIAKRALDRQPAT